MFRLSRSKKGLDRVQEGVHVDGLGQVVDASGRKGFFPVSLHGVGAEADDGDVPQGVVPFQGAGRLQAVHARQLYVHEDEVGPGLPRRAEAFLRVKGFADRVALQFEQGADEFHVHDIVFDDKNGIGHGDLPGNTCRAGQGAGGMRGGDGVGRRGAGHPHALWILVFHAIFIVQEQWSGGFVLKFDRLDIENQDGRGLGRPTALNRPASTDVVGAGQADGARPSWLGVVQACNALRTDPDSWWSRVLADPEAVPRVDEDALVIRLRGHEFLEARLEGGRLACRIRHEYLIPALPGSRAVLTADGIRPESRRIGDLAGLAAHYDAVRRRVIQHPRRRRAILDRLFLRHACVIGVDVALPPGRVDLVALGPDGICVLMLLRRYADQDLRLRGPGGVLARILELEGAVKSARHPRIWIEDVLERARALHGPWARRFAALPPVRRIHPWVRLAVVDFDHAQRLGGLAGLRRELARGLGREDDEDDILAIGDAGNLSHRVIFSGMEE